MTQTRTPSLDTHDERPRRSHSGTLGWDTNKRLMAGHVRERGSDHVNVPTAPGAGHEEPVFPWDRADFRHHVLRLVREYVPAIMEELHTIADLRDPDQIRRDIEACATGRTRAPYMCTRPPLVAPHTSPSRRFRTFRFPMRPTRANVDGRRPPAAATTRRNRVHDPARNRLDRHPFGAPRAAPPPRTVGPQGPTLGALIDADLQDYHVRQFRSHSTARGRTAHLDAFFGRDARAATLTTYQIRQYQLTRRAAGAATGTINRETSALHRMGTLAVHWGWLDTDARLPRPPPRESPPPGLLRAPRIPRRPRPPARSDGRTSSIWLTTSGWRKQEILGLTWEETDMAGGVIRLSPARSKTLVGRILPISRPIADALARRRARRDPDSPLVFHRDGITIRRWRTAWRTACQAAGVPTRFLHDCRRTAVGQRKSASNVELVAIRS